MRTYRKRPLPILASSVSIALTFFSPAFAADAPQSDRPQAAPTSGKQPTEVIVDDKHLSKNELKHEKKEEKAKEKLQEKQPETVAAKRNMVPCISWINPNMKPRIVLFCVHGLGLYSGSYKDFGTIMSRGGVATFAIDVRGFGSWMKSGGKQPVDFTDCLSDIQNSLTSIRSAYPDLPLFIMGESMGGAIALRFASEHPDLVDGLISSVPAGERFKQKKTDLKVALELFKGPNKEFDIGKSIVKQAASNNKQASDWANDPLDRMDLSPKDLIHFQEFMNDNHDAAKLISKLPVLFVQGTQDTLVKPEGTWELFNELGSPNKVFIALPSEHLIFEETQDDTTDRKIRNFRMLSAWLFTQAKIDGNLPQPSPNDHGAKSASTFAPGPDAKFAVMPTANDMGDFTRVVTRVPVNVNPVTHEVNVANPPLELAIGKLMSGQPVAARMMLQKLATLHPKDSEVHYWLSQAYLSTKQPVLAKQELAKSFALNKDMHPAQQADSLAKSPSDAKATSSSIDAASGIGTSSDLAGGKPTVLLFYATWCEQCKSLDAWIGRAKQAFGDTIAVTKLDVDDPKNQDLVNKYRVGPIPTTVFLRSDGKLSSTLIGETNFEVMSNSLTAAMH